MLKTTNFTKPLPQSEGPKLHPFRNRKAPIIFVRLLSDTESEGHAHVFEVSIGSKQYALKIVSDKDAKPSRLVSI